MKSLLTISRNVLLYLVLAFITFSFSVNTFAQNQKSSFGLYSFNSKIPLVTVANNRINDISYLGDEGKWVNVRLKGGIPAWLKSQDITLLPNNKLSLSSEKAKIYINPTNNSRYLLTLNKGFTSSVLAVNGPWYQVSTPTYLTMKMLRSEYNLLTNGSVASSKPLSESSNKPTSEVAKVETVINDNAVEKTNVSSAVNVKKTSPVESAQEAVNASSSSSLNTNNSLSGVAPSLSTYFLTPGDVISISVFGEPDMELNNQRISESGLISFPLIGQVVVKGKSTQQVENSIESLLAKGYLRDPKVNVVVNAYRPLYVRGAVNTPGSYDFTEGLTIAKVLTLAGGVKKGAQDDTLKLYRNDELFLQNLTVDSQTFIQPGDILTVTEGVGAVEKANTFIYLHGEVNSPGGYEYREGLTVEKAVALAGGFSPRASRKKINITREAGEESEPEKLKRVKLFLDLKPGDVIHIGASWF